MDTTEKRNPKPFNSPGGKDAWVPTLLAMTPPHTTYVEPYAGGAALFYGKPPADRSVLSDMDPDIVAIHQFLKSASDADIAWMRRQEWGGGEARYRAILASKPTTLRGKAYRYRYVTFWSARGIVGNYNKERDTAYRQRGGAVCSGWLRKLEWFRDRLKNATVIRGDALSVMQRYDSPSTFHYADPPWKPVGSGEFWKSFDAGALGRVLGKLRGKVIVSYQGELPLPGSFRKRKITITQNGLKQTSQPQWLAWNFDVRASRAKKSAVVWPLDLNNEG